MTLTGHRTFQYVGILLALGLIAGGYWYFAVRAGVKTNTGASQQAGTDDLANGLAAYWRFDENTGTSTTDGSTNGATGTLTNGPAWTTGQVGYALDFDGTNDYVTAPDADALELTLERSRFTIAGWFNRDTFTTDDTIVAKRNGITAAEDGYVVYVDDATDQVIFEFSDGVDEYQLASTTTFTATGWHHFVVTMEQASGNLTMYIDGQPDSPTITGNINDMEPVGNALAFRIGAESDAGNPFDGKIDEVRYYHTRAFTPEQAAGLYRLTVPTGVDTSLKGYWSFDGGERGDYVYDQSGAGNRGTPFGTGTLPAPLPAAGRVGQAMSFDGVDDYVSMGVAPPLTNIANMTTCIWVNPTGATDGSLISKDDSATGWNLVGNSTSIQSVTFYKGWSGGVGYGEWRTADGTLPNNRWTHVCVTYSNSSTANDPIFYIDGTVVSATEVNAPSGTVTDDSTFNAVIGSYGPGMGAFFDGRLDEVRVYNRIFTAAEIKNLYDRSAADKTNTGAGQAQGGSDLAAGLALYWPLDDGSGTNADDKSANANDGTLTNGPTWTTGQISSGVDLDGTNDYIAVADPASGVLDFTNMDTTPAPGDLWSLSLWFNRDTATTDDTLIAKKNSQSTDTDNGYIVWIDDVTDEINVRVDDVTDADHSEVESSTTYTSTGWHQLTVVFDEVHDVSAASDQRCPIIFVDGVDVTDLATCLNYLHYSVDLSNALAFTVGAESDGGNPFDGKVDDVRVYSRPIGATEASLLYQTTVTTTGIDTGLRGYWNFDGPDVTPTTPIAAYDRSGGSNWGSLTNGAALARGRVGQSVRFDGANDYVSIPAATPLNNQHTFTYAAWIYPTGASCGNGYGPIIEKGTGSGLKKSLYIDCSGASGDRKLFGTVDTATTDAMSYTADGAIVYNEWQHVAMTYDNAGDRKVRLYINGREQPYVIQTAGTGTVATDTTDDIAIGATPSTQFYAFVGMIDEPRVYSRVLTSGELESLSAAGSPDKVNTSVSTPQGTGRLDGGLVGYWKLDENTGTSAGDTSTGGNTGTLTNGPTWTTGRIGSALSFDGTNDYVTMGDIAAAEGGTQVTAAAWVKQNGTTNEKHILDKGGCTGGSTNSWELMVISGEPAFYIPAFGGSATGVGLNVSDNAWHHLVGTYDGTTIRIYSDGSLVGTQAASVTLGNDSSAVEIGGNCNGGGSCGGSCYWNGQVDEARVYDRALSGDEIRQLYNLSAPTGTDTGLKGYWSFNGLDMNGTTALDRSGAGNDGTLTNGAVVGRGKLGQAVQFDGTNDYVNAGSASAIDDMTQLTACVWVNASVAPTSYGDLVGKVTTTGWAFEVYNSGSGINPAFFRDFSTQDGNWIASSTILDTGTWYHLCATYNKSSTANDPALYVNGTSVTITESSTPIGTAVTDAAASLEMGSVDGTIDQYTGKLDEVRVYNRILSSSEIQALYNSGR